MCFCCFFKVFDVFCFKCFSRFLIVFEGLLWFLKVYDVFSVSDRGIQINPRMLYILNINIPSPPPKPYSN